MIRDLLRFGRSASPSVLPVVEPGNQKTVLIVDNHPDGLRTMCLALAGEKYLVETAETAASALRKVAGTPPELILLDVRVLTADGASLARRLLADEELASVPIVALTQVCPGTHGANCPSGAYDGHIPKTLDTGAFADQVRDLLRSSTTRPPRTAVDLDIPYGTSVNRRVAVSKLLASIEEGLPDSQFAPGSREALRQLAAVGVGFEHYELAGYLQRAERLSNAWTVRGRSRYRLIIRHCREITDRESEPTPEMAELRIGYLDRRLAEVHVLEQALQEGNFAAVVKAGHNLKGTGSAYGYAEISEIGRSLEAAAKDADAGVVQTLLDRIDSYLGMVRPSGSTAEIDAARK